MEIDNNIEVLTAAQIELLTSADIKNTPALSFQGRKFMAKCVKVYDGDTCTLAFFHKGEMIRHSFRLLGYNAPELKGVEQAVKAVGLQMRDKLRSIILNKFVYVECEKLEKYGRILAHIYTDANKTVSVNDEMSQYMITLEKGELME